MDDHEEDLKRDHLDTVLICVLIIASAASAFFYGYTVGVHSVLGSVG